jgi:hypothetical protein
MAFVTLSLWSSGSQTVLRRNTSDPRGVPPPKPIYRNNINLGDRIFPILPTLYKLNFNLSFLCARCIIIIIIIIIMTTTWWVKISTYSYLQSERFLFIVFYNLVPKIVSNI